MAAFTDIGRLEVIAPNFKYRLSGVTTTIIQLVPEQTRLGCAIASFGPGLPDHLPKLRYRDVWKLWRLPDNGKPRVWHARRNVEMIGGLVLSKILRMPLKLVFTSASQRHHKRLTKWLIRRMDAVIATSDKTATYLDVPNTTIMHGIDTQRFLPPADKRTAKQTLGLDPDAKHIGCFGRVRPSKGTDLFVEAMQHILPDHDNWHAVIAGRATEKFQGFERDLKHSAQNGPASDRIHFVGEHKNIEAWYQAMDLFIAPQRWEGFGLTPLEAMACGVPVIATDVGAFSALVAEGQTGLMTGAPDATSMAKAAQKLISNDALRATMASNAPKHVTQTFSLEREAKAIMNVYEQVSNSQKTGTKHGTQN